MMTESGLESQIFKTALDTLYKLIEASNPLAKMRSRAWDRFETIGLPSRHTEVYRSVKLRTLFSTPFSIANEEELAKEEIASWILPESIHSVLVFINGSYFPKLSDLTALPEKTTTLPLQEAIKTYGTFLNNTWTKNIKQETDPFVTLNGALHQKGAFFYLPAHTIVEVPIQVLHIMTHGNMAMPRLHITVGTCSEVRFVSTNKYLDNSPSFVNIVTDCTLEEGAHLHFTQSLCEENPDCWRFEAFRATLKKNSSLTTIAATEGSITIRTDYKVLLLGENADVSLNGICMLKNNNESHVNVWIDHQAPHCRSNQLFKNVLNDSSKSSFEGKIMVRQAAQKTAAFQLNSNLILSNDAHAESKPNLEIFADDVKASHGATVGGLDPEQIFYMKARGISDKTAQNLLIYGFCEEVIDKITTPSLKDLIANRARNYLVK